MDSALGDFDQLLLADADIGDARRRRFSQAHFVEQFLGARKGLLPVNDAVGGEFVAKEDVFGDRQKRHERQFLVDDDDAQMLAVGDRGEVANFIVVVNFAVIGSGGIDTAQHLHQRRFSGAVFADQCVNFTFANLEVDVVQGLYARKRLGDAPHFKNDVVHVRVFLRQSVDDEARHSDNTSVSSR